MGKSHKTLVKARYFLGRRVEKYISYPTICIEEDSINEKQLKIHLDNPSKELIKDISECINDTFSRFGVKTIIKKYI